MIKAECHSDDRVREASFDATWWFEQASDDDILALAFEGWGAGYVSDAVASSHPDPMPEELAKVFEYLELVGHMRDAPGFTCNVDEADARKWLAQHRPNALKCIDREEL